MYRRLYRHFRRNRKKYLRFASFTVLLSAFRILEHYLLFSTMGFELRINLLTVSFIVFIAFTFTIISELTEKVVEKEEPAVERFIRKEESLIEDREKSIWRRLKKRVKI